MTIDRIAANAAESHRARGRSSILCAAGIDLPLRRRYIPSRETESRVLKFFGRERVRTTRTMSDIDEDIMHPVERRSRFVRDSKASRDTERQIRRRLHSVERSVMAFNRRARETLSRIDGDTLIFRYVCAIAGQVRRVFPLNS